MEEEGGAFARSVEQDSVTSVYVYIYVYTFQSGEALKISIYSLHAAYSYRRVNWLSFFLFWEGMDCADGRMPSDRRTTRGKNGKKDEMLKCF